TPTKFGSACCQEAAMISDEARTHRLERKAILYIWQSSAHQVLHNRESSPLQYAMRDRLATLGWSEIEVIDDDLARSAAGPRSARLLRTDGCASLPRQGWRSRGARSLALCPQ